MQSANRMSDPKQRASHMGISFVCLLALIWLFSSLAAGQVTVVNMTPTPQSNEVNNDAEPNIAVNPANANQIAATAFTPCPTAGSNAPIYVSTDGGANWTLNCIVPGGNTTFGTGDVTIRFAGSGGMLYAGDLRGDSFLVMNILRTSDFTAMTPMTVLETRGSEDQPYIQATTVLGGSSPDRVYVGNNNTSGSQSATVDLSLDAATAPPPAGFGPHGVETRTTCGQDGPPTRTAVHANGTIYAAFFRWVSGATGCAFGITTVTADVVVVRDDNWGSGTTPFSALSDVPSPPGDGLVGRRVATSIPLRWRADFGSQITLSSQISIAVDPNDSRVVWLAWADGANTDASNYTIHVRNSTNSGATWSGDLKSVVSATNPALAINSSSKVALLYQRFVNPGTCASGGSCWETHVERTQDGTTWSDLILANVSAAAHTATHRDIGDYDHVMASGKDFYGVFSADNTPNLTNFPNSVTYLRHTDFATHQLFADAAHTTTVGTSIDPFFFHITELAAGDDFYVRDWSDGPSPANHDQGQEPSTNPVFYLTSDVWNRRSNTTGGFDAVTDRPGHENPWEAALGHNYAFTRISRKAAAAAGSADRSATATFLFADFGLGTTYSSIGSLPPASFHAADTVQVIPDGSGLQWDLPVTHSSHVCMAVEISVPAVGGLPADNFTGDLIGHAPGWPTTDLMVINDNNKAQRNMGIYPALGASSVSFFAIIRNAADFSRDIVVRRRVDEKVAPKLRGARIEIIAGDGHELQSGDTVTLPNMKPGESRWLGLNYALASGKLGEVLPVEFEEIVGNQAVNGFTIAARLSSWNAVVGENLRFHIGVFSRLAAAGKIPEASKESHGALILLKKRPLPASYLAFLKQQTPLTESLLKKLIEVGRSGDPFRTQESLKALQLAVNSSSAVRAAAAHMVLLHKLDAFQTMLQQKGYLSR
jgi:hypothetical protein